MTLFTMPPDDKPDRTYGQIGLLAAVPALLIAGPLIGFFIGRWADKRFGTDPYLLILGVVLGFAAAGVEIYGLVKKSQEMEDDKND